MSELSRALRANPSPAAWSELLDALGETRGDAFDDALAAAQVALAAWPDELRAAPLDAWQDVVSDEPPRWWPLVRHLELLPDALGDEPPPAGPLAAIRSIVLRGSELTSLDGWPPLPGVRRLVLAESRDLANVRGLANLPALEQLDLTRCRRLELASLPALAALAELRLAHNPHLGDLAPLAQQRALRWLDVRGCQAGDVAPLAGLDALRTVWLDGDAAARLGPLAGAPLDELVIGRAGRADTASIAAMPALRQLNLADVAALDCAPLAGASIRELYLVRCSAVRGLDALATMAHLRSLYVEEVAVPAELVARLRAGGVEVISG